MKKRYKLFLLLMFWTVLSKITKAQDNNRLLHVFIQDSSLNTFIPKYNSLPCDTFYIIDTGKYFIQESWRYKGMIFKIENNRIPLSELDSDREIQLLTWKCKIQIIKITHTRSNYRIYFYNLLSETHGYYEYIQRKNKFIRKRIQVGQS